MKSPVKNSYYAAIALMALVFSLIVKTIQTLEENGFKLEFSILFFLFFISLYGFLLLSRNKQQGWKVFLSLYLLLMANGVFLFYARTDKGWSFITLLITFAALTYCAGKMSLRKLHRKSHSRVVTMPSPIPQVEIVNDVYNKSVYSRKINKNSKKKKR